MQTINKYIQYYIRRLIWHNITYATVQYRTVVKHSIMYTLGQTILSPVQRAVHSSEMNSVSALWKVLCLVQKASFIE